MCLPDGTFDYLEYDMPQLHEASLSWDPLQGLAPAVFHFRTCRF